MTASWGPGLAQGHLGAPLNGRSLGKTAERGTGCGGSEEGGVRCGWHPSPLCLLLPLPEDFSFSPPSRQPPCNLHLCSHPYVPRTWLPGRPLGGSLAAFITLPMNFWETRVGQGTEEQGRVISCKQAQGTQALTRPSKWVDREPPGPTAMLSLSSPGPRWPIPDPSSALLWPSWACEEQS